MTKLLSFNIKTLQGGVEGRPSPDRLIEGDPVTTTWLMEDQAAQAGIWAATEGAQRMERGDTTWELFTILDGEVEIAEDGGAPQRFGPGDTVIVKPGFQGIWRTLHPVKKSFVTLEIPSSSLGRSNSLKDDAAARV